MSHMDEPLDLGIDEDETHIVTTFGGTEVALLRTGLDLAKCRARSAYVRGEITVEQFEREIGRLLAKQDKLSA